MLALSLSALAGFVGLGKTASWCNTKRTMHRRSRRAASAAALALAANEASSTFTTLAKHCGLLQLRQWQQWHTGGRQLSANIGKLHQQRSG
jgi:hypothetical protein